ncbi:MAG: hypothetical protein QOG53_2631 [Frankiales bacterium]|nr:hypothetical protein [Frankiales bacterium]
MSRTSKIPDAKHPITIEPTDARVVVSAGDIVIADTTAALTLREAGYPPVQYVPITDVDPSRLRRTDSATYCPYKGDASYYSIVTADGEIVDAVWSYEQPYPAVAEIAGHVAFYPDRVHIEVTVAA